MHRLGYCSWYSNLLQAGHSRDRTPVGARFSAPVQTGPEAHLCNGYWVFSGVKWPVHGVEHPSPSSTEFKERAEIYIYSPSGPLWPVLPLFNFM